MVFEHYGGLMTTDGYASADVGLQVVDVNARRRVGRQRDDRARTRFVPDYIPSLRGTSWEGCTLQHLLDMRAGTLFDEENYDDPDSDGRLIEQVSGYTTRLRSDIPANTYEWIRQLGNAESHGGAFKYRSILPDVLGLGDVPRQRARRSPSCSRKHIWSRFAAHDADIIVDSAGLPGRRGRDLHDARRPRPLRRDVPAAWRLRWPPDRAGASGCIARRLGRRNYIDAFVLPRQAGRQGPNCLLSRLLVGLRQRGRHLLRPRHQRPGADDPSPGEHGDRQVLDVARPHGLRLPTSPTPVCLALCAAL